MQIWKIIIVFIFICLFCSTNAPADMVWKDMKGYTPPSVLGTKETGVPNQQIRVHKVGSTHMTVTNYGWLGNRITYGLIDPETGLRAPSCEHPPNSNLEYLYWGGLWIGAIIEDDTLVSVGVDGWQRVFEMYPNPSPEGEMQKRSRWPDDPDHDPEAISDADYIAVYYDTLTDTAYVKPTPFDGRPHIPLDLKIRQESYSWSNQQFRDFIILRYIITNIGSNFLEDMYFGFYMDGDAYNWVINDVNWSTNITGCYIAQDTQTGQDVIIGYITDCNGDPDYGEWTEQSVRGAIGFSLLDFPVEPQVSYNWWVSEAYNPDKYDWGPMMAANYRDYGTGGLGTPEGDCNKYYVMSNGEIDYDQIYSRLDHSGEGWLPPGYDPLMQILTSGYDARFLLSFGTVVLPPGDSLEFAVVVTVGDDVHQNPNDFDSLFDMNNPQPFYDALDFSDMVNDIMTARRLYNQLFVEYECGDANHDEETNIIDIVYSINYIFIGGDEPYPYFSGDLNCDSKINLADVIYLIYYLFRSGDLPCDINGDGLPDC